MRVSQAAQAISSCIFQAEIQPIIHQNNVCYNVHLNFTLLKITLITFASNVVDLALLAYQICNV